MTNEQLQTLVRYADTHLDDWRTGIEDGTYDDNVGLEELVVAIAAGYAEIEARKKPVIDAAESLLKRALHACNTAKRFRFAVFDDSYKLAADIESYLKATTGKSAYTRED